MRFAMKANEVVVNGQKRDVFKEPIGDPTKSSKAGRVGVIKAGDTYVTVRENAAVAGNLLQPVWRNGKLLRDVKFDEVRERATVRTS